MPSSFTLTLCVCFILFLSENPGGWCSSEGQQVLVLTLLEGRMERESSSPSFLPEVRLISVESYERETASCRYELRPVTDSTHRYTTRVLSPLLWLKSYHYYCYQGSHPVTLFSIRASTFWIFFCTLLMWSHTAQHNCEYFAEAD